METKSQLNVYYGLGLLFLASLYWLLSSYYALQEEFAHADVLYISIAFFAVLIIESAVAVLVSKFSRTGSVVLLTLLLVGNAFSNNLSMSDQFMTMGPLAMAGILLAGALVTFVIVRAAMESGAAGKIILAVVAVLVVSTPITHALSGNKTAPAFVEGLTGNVRNVEFTSKPNVYFIAFESMVPPPVLSKYLKFNDTSLRDALERNNFRLFRNLFSEGAPTDMSLQSLLALDLKYLGKVYTPYALVSGASPSPLREIFKHNGYETNFVSMTSFFGEEGGPYVDHYRYNESFSVCTFMDPFKVPFAFFGACRLHGQPWWRDVGKVDGQDIDFLIANLREISGRSKPQFLLAYMHPLEHTAADFSGTPAELDAFRASYGTDTAQAAANVDRIVTFLRKNDPNALLFIFGDHGIYISRRVRLEDDKMFYMQDRYAVMGGFYPEDACTSSFDKPISDRFVTTPQVARMLIRCLAGGVDAFDASYQHKIFQIPAERFEDYIYE